MPEVASDMPVDALVVIGYHPMEGCVTVQPTPLVWVDKEAFGRFGYRACLEHVHCARVEAVVRALQQWQKQYTQTVRPKSGDIPEIKASVVSGESVQVVLPATGSYSEKPIRSPQAAAIIIRTLKGWMRGRRPAEYPTECPTRREAQYAEVLSNLQGHKPILGNRMLAAEAAAIAEILSGRASDALEDLLFFETSEVVHGTSMSSDAVCAYLATGERQDWLPPDERCDLDYVRAQLQSRLRVIELQLKKTSPVQASPAGRSAPCS